MMLSARLGAMSGVPKAPAAPRLRAIREAWLRPVIGQLEADPGISAGLLRGRAPAQQDSGHAVVRCLGERF